MQTESAMDAIGAIEATNDLDAGHASALRVDRHAPLSIRVWDLPLRVFHWSLANAVITAIASGKIGGSLMWLHAKAGLAIIGLVAFRLAWGIIGSTHARFVNFAPTPAKILAYLKGKWQGVGHNPLGALSVFALLGLLALQAGIGLFIDDDIDFSGPYHALIGQALAGRLAELHQQLSTVLLTLVVLHVVAIIFYLLFKKNNLVTPMVTGRKAVRSGTTAAKGDAKSGIVALVASLLVACAAVYFASGAVLKKTPVSAPAPVKTAPAW